MKLVHCGKARTEKVNGWNQSWRSAGSNRCYRNVVGSTVAPAGVARRRAVEHPALPVGARPSGCSAVHKSAYADMYHTAVCGEYC